MNKPDAGKSGNPEETKAAEQPSPMDFFRTARGHLKNGRQKEAYSVFIQAIVHYPDEPVLLSFYGSLQALVDKKFRTGIESCRKALASFKPSSADAAATLYPVFYLNLGKAYLASGKKKEAVMAYQKGLSYDKGNSELKKEMKNLGLRKAPVLPFLDRSNPLNIVAGRILNKPR